MESLTRSQNSPIAPLKFRNGYIISPYILLGMWLFINAEIKVPWSLKGPHASCVNCFRQPEVHWDMWRTIPMVRRNDQVSEWVIKFNGIWGAADIAVYVVHKSRVIIAYTLESLSSLT